MNKKMVSENIGNGYVYQLMTVPTDTGGMMLNDVLSITDETLE